MEIDNIKLILPFLKFDSEDDFYYLQILQRKKENPQLDSNSRVIKNYYINSIEYLLSHYEEIKTLCRVFNARASIRLNKRSYEKVAFKALIKLTDTIFNKDYISCTRSYDKAIGANHNDNNKKWIVDLDEIYQTEPIYLERLKNRINKCNPEGNKVIATIPSKSGIHLITNPFNIQEFSQYKYMMEIHKDNPTNLYCP